MSTWMHFVCACVKFSIRLPASISVCMFILFRPWNNWRVRVCMFQTLHMCCFQVLSKERRRKRGSGEDSSDEDVEGGDDTQSQKADGDSSPPKKRQYVVHMYQQYMHTHMHKRTHACMLQRVMEHNLETMGQCNLQHVWEFYQCVIHRQQPFTWSPPCWRSG